MALAMLGACCTSPEACLCLLFSNACQGNKIQVAMAAAGGVDRYSGMGFAYITGAAMRIK